MTPAAPEELMLQDLRDRYASVDVDPAFGRLYTEVSEAGPMFASFHQRINALFEHMNRKIGVNRHFNAEESRELISLIAEISDAQQIMERVGVEFNLVDSYQRVLSDCSSFLVPSGGSSIPDDFETIDLVRWEPVFIVPDTRVLLPERYSSADLRMVDSGSFAHVYRYTDPVYGITIGLKRAKRGLPPADLVRFRNEFDVMKELHHPYVLQVFKYDEDQSQYTMEYCDATLRSYIERNNATMSTDRRKRLSLQFLYGLNYLHTKQILHRDLSLQNVLVKEYDAGAAIVKLSDFGLLKVHDSTLTRTESELRGTILDPTIVSFKDYSLANEIYAIGFVISFIFSGRQDIGACSGTIRSIINGCVAYDHADRHPDVKAIIREVELLDPYETRTT